MNIYTTQYHKLDSIPEGLVRINAEDEPPVEFNGPNSRILCFCGDERLGDELPLLGWKLPEIGTKEREELFKSFYQEFSFFWAESEGTPEEALAELNKLSGGKDCVILCNEVHAQAIAKWMEGVATITNI